MQEIYHIICSLFIARGPEELLLTPELGNQCTAQNTSLCYIHLMSYIHYFHGSKENTFIANAVVYTRRRQCMEGQSYWHGGSSAARPCTNQHFIFTPPSSRPTLYCIYRSSYTLTIFDKTPQPGKPSDARSMLFYVCFLPESYVYTRDQKNNMSVQNIL